MAGAEGRPRVWPIQRWLEARRDGVLALECGPEQRRDPRAGGEGPVAAHQRRGGGAELFAAAGGAAAGAAAAAGSPAGSGRCLVAPAGAAGAGGAAPLWGPARLSARARLQRRSVRRMSLSSSSRCNGSVGERSNSGIRCSTKPRACSDSAWMSKPRQPMASPRLPTRVITSRACELVTSRQQLWRLVSARGGARRRPVATR